MVFLQLHTDTWDEQSWYEKLRFYFRLTSWNWKNHHTWRKMHNNILTPVLLWSYRFPTIWLRQGAVTDMTCKVEPGSTQHMPTHSGQKLQWIMVQLNSVFFRLKWFSIRYTVFFWYCLHLLALVSHLSKLIITAAVSAGSRLKPPSSTEYWCCLLYQ